MWKDKVNRLLIPFETSVRGVKLPNFSVPLNFREVFIFCVFTTV
jgi:hypothetical protein